MRHATEEELGDVDHSIEVGLCGSLYRDKLGLDYLTAGEMLSMGPKAAAARIYERVACRRAFIGFDIDVIDPAFAPWTATPEAAGLSLAQDSCGYTRTTGAIATLAANLAYEIVSLVALRRLGRKTEAR
jgi:arginase family enzyme